MMRQIRVQAEDQVRAVTDHQAAGRRPMRILPVLVQAEVPTVIKAREVRHHRRLLRVILSLQREAVHHQAAVEAIIAVRAAEVHHPEVMVPGVRHPAEVREEVPVVAAVVHPAAVEEDNKNMIIIFNVKAL